MKACLNKSRYLVGHEVQSVRQLGLTGTVNLAFRRGSIAAPSLRGANSAGRRRVCLNK